MIDPNWAGGQGEKSAFQVVNIGKIATVLSQFRVVKLFELLQIVTGWENHFSPNSVIHGKAQRSLNLADHMVQERELVLRQVFKEKSHLFFQGLLLRE